MLRAATAPPLLSLAGALRQLRGRDASGEAIVAQLEVMLDDLRRAPLDTPPEEIAATRATIERAIDDVGRSSGVLREIADRAPQVAQEIKLTAGHAPMKRPDAPLDELKPDVRWIVRKPVEPEGPPPKSARPVQMSFVGRILKVLGLGSGVCAADDIA